MKKIAPLILLVFLIASCKKQDISVERISKAVNMDASVTYTINTGDSALTCQWEVNGIPVGSNSASLTCPDRGDDIVTCKTSAKDFAATDEYKSAAAASLLINGNGLGTTDWEDRDQNDNGLADHWYSHHRMRWAILSNGTDKYQKVTGMSTHPYQHISDRPDVGEKEFKLHYGETYYISFTYTSAPDSLRIAFTSCTIPPCDRPSKTSRQFTYYGPDGANISFYSIDMKPGNCNDWFTLDNVNLFKVR